MKNEQGLKASKKRLDSLIVKMIDGALRQGNKKQALALEQDWVAITVVLESRPLDSGDVETEKQFLWAAFLEGIQTGGKTIQFPAIDFSSFLNKIHFPHHHAYFADKDTPKTGEQ